MIHSMQIESPDVLRHREGVIFISAAIYAEKIKRDIATMGLQQKIEVLG